MAILNFNGLPGTYSLDGDKKLLFKDIEEISKISKGDLNPKDLNRLVFLSERIAISSRGKLEKIENEPELSTYLREEFSSNSKALKQRKSVLTFDKNLPVKVEKKNDVLHVVTPFTFKRGMKESYFLADYLNSELKKEENLKLLEEYDHQKFTVLVVRCDEKYSRTRHKDNDNLETTELINVIFDNLCISDNALNMSFFSEFIFSKKDEEIGFHLFLIPYDKYDNFKGRYWLDKFYS